MFYLAWATFALFAATAGQHRRAVWLVLFSGWLFLPPGDHGFTGREDFFPYWILGGGLPSDTWLDKAWLAPMLALALLGWQVLGRWRRIRPHWTDAAMLAFCLWPVAQSVWVDVSLTTAIGTAGYLLALWGSCWMLGRLFLQSEDDAVAFAQHYAGLSILLVPVAIVEGILPLRVHSFAFGVHPLAFDGVERYFGYRPQALFEDGNQYGIWCAGSVVAAFWLWCRVRAEPRSEDQDRKARRWASGTLVLGTMLLAAQSVGAVLLGAGGIAILSARNGFRIAQQVVPIMMLAMLGLLVLHLSGIVPIRWLVTSTPFGAAALDTIRATGRGSFAWRIGQDLKILPMLKENLIFGSGHWNWFMPAGTRPWGLPLLLLGQFGLVGSLALGLGLGGALLRQVRSVQAHTDLGALAAIMVVLFLGDAAMNSFLLFPALVAAGAVSPLQPSRGRHASAKA